MTKLFYDFEFYEDGKLIIPISLGCVTSDDREFYAVNLAILEGRDSYWVWDANPWLKANVRDSLFKISPHDVPEKQQILDVVDIGKALQDFVKPYKKVEFIGYYADYDHVALAQLFGTMMQLPKGFPMWTRDLKQWVSDVGNPTISIANVDNHNSLADARWNRDVYKWLTNNFIHPAWDDTYQLHRRHHG